MEDWAVSAAWCLSLLLAHQPLGTELTQMHSGTVAQWHSGTVRGDHRVLEMVRPMSSSTGCHSAAPNHPAGEGTLGDPRVEGFIPRL